MYVHLCIYIYIYITFHVAPFSRCRGARKHVRKEGVPASCYDPDLTWHGLMVNPWRDTV